MVVLTTQIGKTVATIWRRFRSEEAESGSPGRTRTSDMVVNSLLFGYRSMCRVSNIIAITLATPQKSYFLRGLLCSRMRRLSKYLAMVSRRPKRLFSRRGRREFSGFASRRGTQWPLQRRRNIVQIRHRWLLRDRLSPISSRHAAGRGGPGVRRTHRCTCTHAPV